MKPVVRLWSMLVLLTAPFAGTPQPSRIPVDVSQLGPQIGERVPGFNLKDQSGTTRTLPSVMGAKGAMIVFFRSVDW